MWFLTVVSAQWGLGRVDGVLSRIFFMCLYRVVIRYILCNVFFKVGKLAFENRQECALELLIVSGIKTSSATSQKFHLNHLYWATLARLPKKVKIEKYQYKLKGYDNECMTFKYISSTVETYKVKTIYWKIC